MEKMFNFHQFHLFFLKINKNLSKENEGIIGETSFFILSSGYSFISFAVNSRTIQFSNQLAWIGRSDSKISKLTMMAKKFIVS